MYQTQIQEIFTIWYGEIEFLANEEHRGLKNIIEVRDTTVWSQ